MSALDWRELALADRQREYSPSSRVGDLAPYLARYRSASERVRARREVIRYGPGAEQVVVLFPGATPQAPLHVFFHGGYWQELSVADSLFAADGFSERGLAFATVGYELAPAITLGEIVKDCRLAFRCLLAEAGVEPRRVVVSGSSAGAHLAAMVALAPGTEPPPPIDAAVLVSGIYELEPLLGTTINDALALDARSARALSPQLMAPAARPTVSIFVGDNETGQFKRQSSRYAEHLRAHGVPVVEHEIEGRNHFDVVLDLAEAGTILGDHALRLASSDG